MSDGLYRGAIEIQAGGGLDAINVVSLDDYVRGVVAGEMPSSWPLEALKAQAVTARTYALATRHPEGPFDLYPDTRSQVYRGVVAEGVRSNAAVAGTAGRILTYGGEPAVTYYFSTSGGHTESIQYSFVGALSKPWLVGVTDPYDFRSPYHRWKRSFTTAQLTRALGSRGSFRRLKVVKRGTSPRVVKAQVIGSRGTTTISGPTIRARLALRDTWMRFTRVVDLRPLGRQGPGGRLELAADRPLDASARQCERDGELRPRPALAPADPRAQDRRALEACRRGAHRRSRALPQGRQATRRLPGAGRRGGRTAGQGALRLSAAVPAPGMGVQVTIARGDRPLERRGQQPREARAPAGARWSPSPANQDARPAL